MRPPGHVIVPDGSNRDVETGHAFFWSTTNARRILPVMRLSRIVSGGQTGADQGGLAAASYGEVPHGGLAPSLEKTFLIHSDDPYQTCYGSKADLSRLLSTGVFIHSKFRHGIEPCYF